MRKQEFDELAERNRPAELELRLNNARYLGELVKFKLLPPAAFFGCLKACVDAFSAPNALVACTLLESCGRYLHRAKETQPRVDAMLELLTKLRSAHRGRLLGLGLGLGLGPGLGLGLGLEMGIVRVRVRVSRAPA